MTYNYGINKVIYFYPTYAMIKEFSYEDFWNLVRKLSKDNKVFVSSKEAPKDFKQIFSGENEENLFIYKGDKEDEE